MLFLDGRDLAVVVVALTASAKVPVAGVDGLLARPLLVVVTVVLIGGGSIAVCDTIEFVLFLISGSSAGAVTALLFSFLVVPALATGSGGTGGLISVSGFAASVLAGAGAGGSVSFGAFASEVDLLCGTASTTAGVMPLGLFVAAVAGRCCIGSVVDAVEFPRARDEAGRGGRGTGELRPALVSGRDPRRGDAATDGELAAFVLLQHSG